MIITRATYTIVFWAPMTPLITNIFGRDKDGPASNNASAGPLPMPEASRSLDNRHLGQGGEIHECTRETGEEVRKQ